MSCSRAAAAPGKNALSRSRTLKPLRRDWRKSLNNVTPRPNAYTRLCMNGARNTRIPTESSTGNPCAERHGRETDAVGAVEHETGCGQVKVGDKSNEIPAARKLLRSMQLSRRIVTADAMHTQAETTRLILDRGADYGCQGQDDTRRKRLTETAVGKIETKNARSNRHSQLSGLRTRQNLGRVRRTARTTASIPYAYVIKSERPSGQLRRLLTE